MSVTNTSSPEGIKPYTISAAGISATFIAHGARLTHLHVKDKSGVERDVVVGYDDPAEYYKDTQSSRTYYGCIVG
jgi:aldose 1-epimerase